MAIKTFTPFGKGKRIKADEWDAAFQLDGLQGTIEGITGEQVAKEGITCDVVNKGRATLEGSATTDASGCPYYFGRKSKHCPVTGFTRDDLDITLAGRCPRLS